MIGGDVCDCRNDFFNIARDGICFFRNIPREEMGFDYS